VAEVRGLEVAEALREGLKEGLREASVVKPGRVKVVVERGFHRRAVEALKARFGELHVFSIVGADRGGGLELTYNLWLYGPRVHVMLKTSLPKEDPDVETITDLVPGATLYEREVYEMLGVRFKGHPNLARLFLPEGWPEGLYPLRKEVKLEELERCLP
jgi:membrane-bound hydrogenase subunit beta